MKTPSFHTELPVCGKKDSSSFITNLAVGVICNYALVKYYDQFSDKMSVWQINNTILLTTRWLKVDAQNHHNSPCFLVDY